MKNRYEMIIIAAILILYVMVAVVMLEIVYFEKTLTELVEGVNLIIKQR